MKAHTAGDDEATIAKNFVKTKMKKTCYNWGLEKCISCSLWSSHFFS